MKLFLSEIQAFTAVLLKDRHDHNVHNKLSLTYARWSDQLAKRDSCTRSTLQRPLPQTKKKHLHKLTDRQRKNTFTNLPTDKEKSPSQTYRRVLPEDLFACRRGQLWAGSAGQHTLDPNALWRRCRSLTTPLRVLRHLGVAWLLVDNNKVTAGWLKHKSFNRTLGQHRKCAKVFGTNPFVQVKDWQVNDDKWKMKIVFLSCFSYWCWDVWKWWKNASTRRYFLLLLGDWLVNCQLGQEVVWIWVAG